nr:hypothetical protein GCM10020185_66690 [Pseudomonas brassicacearum subsp. brassicacearum]
MLAKYHAQYPQVSLELSTGTWAQLLDDIQHHRLDGVIVAVDIERPGLKRAVMYREDLVLIASESHGPLRSAADLQGKAIFMWPTGCPYRLALEQWLLRHDQVQPIISIASYGAIVGCVSAGAGVSLVPRGIYEQYRQGAGWTGYEFPELTGIDNLFTGMKTPAGILPERRFFGDVAGGVRRLGVARSPVARELAPAGLRSRPEADTPAC